jgi:cyclophilin family peptidyl-prolyl cis-trans isomerase
MKTRLVLALCVAFASAHSFAASQTAPGAGPVVILETAIGTIEFETYPEEAPKTVAQIIALVKRNFYDGLRFHRAERELGLVQVGDPQSRNMLNREMWGRAGSGKPIGAAEMTRKRRHVRGAVAMAYAGTNPRSADSQFFIELQPHPEWDAKYTVFGRVIKGIELVEKIQVGDVLKRASVREGQAVP